MNVVEYVLRARDYLSTTLQNAARTAQAAAAQVDRMNANAGRVPRNIQQLNDHLSRLQERQQQAFSVQNIARYNTMIRRTQQELQRLNNMPPQGYLDRMRESVNQTDNLTGSIRNMIGAYAAFQGVKTVLTLGASMEQNKIGFEVLLGSAQKAKLMLGQIIAYANTNQYENVGLIKNAKTLLAFGTSAEKILPSLRTLGDIAMGDSQRLESLTLAYAQMTAAGRLQGNDLLQMVNAGFNPLQELHLMTGKSLKYYRDQMEKGQISTAMIEQAFQHATSSGGKFFNMMDRMSQTTTGKYEIMVGTFKQTVATIGERLLPTVNQFLQVGIKLTDWVSNNIDMVIQLGGVLLSAVAVFKVVTFAIRMWTIAQAILNGTMLLNPVGLIVAGIAALIAIVIIAWNKLAWFRGIVYGLWESFKTLAGFIKDGVMSVFHGVVSTFQGLGMIIESLFNRDWKGIKEGAKQAASGFNEAFSGAVSLSPVGVAINTGRAVAKSFAKGYKGGQTDFQKEKAAKEKENTIDANSFLGDKPKPTKDTPEDKIKNIAGGGSKITHVTVSLNKEMVGQIIINPLTMSQGVDDVKDKVMTVLSELLNSANRIAIE